MAVATTHGSEQLPISLVSSPDVYQSDDLTPANRAALQLADALMTQPGSITAELRAQLHEHFTPTQIREITLDVMKWNYQKVLVGLGIDAEVVAGELTGLSFDEDGQPVVHFD